MRSGTHERAPDMSAHPELAITGPHLARRDSCCSDTECFSNSACINPAKHLITLDAVRTRKTKPQLTNGTEPERDGNPAGEFISGRLLNDGVVIADAEGLFIETR